MNNCHTTQSFKIPFKECRDSVIDHNLVTVKLGIEWPSCGGDDPNLIVNITNKTPTVPHIQPNPSTSYINSLNPGNTPDTASSYYHPFVTNATQSTIFGIGTGANDLSSYTASTIVAYNNRSIPRQRAQSPVIIEQIKTSLQSDWPPPIPQQTYLTFQDVIHTPPNSIEQPGYDTNVSLSNPSLGINSMATTISPYSDSRTSPTRSNNPQSRFLLCRCPNPTNHHIPSCPTNSINHPDLHVNHTQFHPPNFPTQIESFCSLENSTKTLDSSSVMTPISQQTVYSNNYPQSALNMSHIPINNQSSFQNNSSMPLTGSEQRSKKPKKKSPLRRKNSIKLEQIQTETSSHLPTQPISTRKSSISNPPSLLSSPILVQTEAVPLCDSSQKANNSLSSSTNDIKFSMIPIASPRTSSSIRSPVELDIPVTQTIDQVKVTDDAVNQIIDEVVQGQGDIILDKPTRKSSTSSSHSCHHSNGSKFSIVNSLVSPGTENVTKRIRSNSMTNFDNKHLTDSSINSNQQQQQLLNMNEYDPSQSVFYSFIEAPNDVQVLQPEHSIGMSLDDIFAEKHDKTLNAVTPPSFPLSSANYSFESARTEQTFSEPLREHICNSASSPNKSNVYEANPRPPSITTWETNQVASSIVSTTLNPPDNHVISTQCYSQTEIYTETNRQTQTFKKSLTKKTFSMKTNVNIATGKSSKIIKTKQRLNIKQTKPKCTRCGRTNLIDITSHEFPNKKGLIYECTGCGNNSIRSNISSEERRKRLAKVAADHLNPSVCQFCHRTFHSHQDYITHLKDDHQSDKPMKNS